MKTASVTFRTTPEFKEKLKSQPKMSQWIEDACLAKMNGLNDLHHVRQIEPDKDVRQKKQKTDSSGMTLAEKVLKAREVLERKQKPKVISHFGAKRAE